MKDTFRCWNDIGKMEIDDVVDRIVTGKTAADAKPDCWLTDFVKVNNSSPHILDFGCGVGRNSFWLANKNPTWNIIGYDNENMLSNTDKFCEIHYDGKVPHNLTFSSDWDYLKSKRFDLILCILVLQHIYEEPLSKYLFDFKNMADKLFVGGRRVNDGPEKKSTWSIIERNGLIPEKFYSGHILIPYTPKGDPEEHNLAYYTLNG